MDFRCTEVHNDFLISVGSSFGFWFVGWVFLCFGFVFGCLVVLYFMFFPFLVDHAVLFICLMLLESFKVALGWLYFLHFPCSLSLSSLYLCLEKWEG